MNKDEALEKKAENARELGLNYEPDWTPERIAGMARLKEAQDKKLAQTKQESYWERVARIKEEMLKLAYEENKLLKDFQPQRKPLTDEKIGEVAIKSQDGISPHNDTLRFARAIEAAHGIKGEA